MEKTRIAVLVSGGGTNLQALIDRSDVILNGEIVLVVSDRKAYATERAQKAGIEAQTLVKGKDFAENLLKLLKSRRIELIVLAGFLSILSGEILTEYRGKIINVHPSLIPKHCGKGFYGLKVHEDVLNCGDAVTGATVHMVNEVTDGGRILVQRSLEVYESDTPEALQKRVMERCEWKLLPKMTENEAKRIAYAKSGAKLCCESFEGLLASNSYPGRGVAIGKTPDGSSDVIVYFIMGRSFNSRNRAFVESDRGVDIVFLHPDKVEDASLVFYSPIVFEKGYAIVTNGDQTDTIADFVRDGDQTPFVNALLTRTYEPDNPNFTPRISGIIYPNGGVYGDFSLSMLKRNAFGESERDFYNFGFENGFGRFIHTYESDGNPLPTYDKEPHLVDVENDIDAYAEKLWNSLNPDNKVALAVCYIDVKTRNRKIVIKNKA
ncbi:MAG: phosphoribosylglycinamide formyltransferase [Clostridia bacterium]|nr:phosphoribosylglycinamide formyltransferase [Clostridia bacterium]